MSNSATTNTTGFYETPQKENKLGQFLPPIFAWPTPATAVDYSGLATPSPPPPPPPSSYAKDIIDTINATILLQRLSQDDGARPFRPMHPDSIPSKVIVGNQEFRICWDN
jgi:hypothetical protein